MSIGKYSVVKLKELQLGDVATDLTISHNVTLRTSVAWINNLLECLVR